MISDLISHAPHYHTLGPRFAAGLKWLSDFSPDTADGRYDIEGDRVFALVQSYTTVPASEKKYESHRLYADIQFIAAGAESNAATATGATALMLAARAGSTDTVTRLVETGADVNEM